MPAALTTARSPGGSGSSTGASAARSLMSTGTGWSPGAASASAPRSTAMTFQASARKRSATARPIPLAAPVTSTVSVRKEAAVDDQLGPGGEARIIRGEEGNDAGDLAHMSAAAPWRLPDETAVLPLRVHRP